MPLTHLLHVPPTHGRQPSASGPVDGGLFVTKCARIRVPGCAGYGETGRVRTVGREDDAADSTRRSERCRDESIAETGLKVGLDVVPVITKEPEGPANGAPLGADRSGRTTGLKRICSRHHRTPNRRDDQLGTHLLQRVRARHVQRLATRELGRAEREAGAVRDLVLRAVLRDVDDHRDGRLRVLLRVERHAPLRRGAALVGQRRLEHEPAAFDVLRDQRRELRLRRAVGRGAPREERMLAAGVAVQLGEDVGVEARREGGGLCADTRPWAWDRGRVGRRGRLADKCGRPDLGVVPGARAGARGNERACCEDGEGRDVAGGLV